MTVWHLPDGFLKKGSVTKNVRKFSLSINVNGTKMYNFALAVGAETDTVFDLLKCLLY